MTSQLSKSNLVNYLKSLCVLLDEFEYVRIGVAAVKAENVRVTVSVRGRRNLNRRITYRIGFYNLVTFWDSIICISIRCSIV